MSSALNINDFDYAELFSGKNHDTLWKTKPTKASPSSKSILMNVFSFINGFDYANPLFIGEHHDMIMNSMTTKASPSYMLPLMNVYNFIYQ
jgi:hypothetical protein